ncbi:hypothetical protein [uncultured Psychroserpens sp.]|uniref:hypothetical protein n=1 Tax=uncultured Psychroserpens sp. TaxID=255436 RepID=UPI002629F72B|nr:hypothetical protein [uncultured Psychroserpens sp.]
MRTSIQVSIPEPCHEDWNQMTPNEKGRHCISCHKTVTDFTASTDEQIVKTLQSETNLCGRFKPTQLQRKLVLSRKERNNYLSYVASTLFAFLSLGAQEVNAQGKPQIIKVDSTEHVKLKGKTAVSILDHKMITVTVYGESKNRLAYAFISLKGSTNKVKTNMAGDATLKCKINDTIRVECSGFETVDVLVKQASTYKITLEPIYYKISSVVGMVSSVEEEKRPNASNVQIIGRISPTSIPIPTKKERRMLIRNGTIERTSVGNFLYNISSIFRRKE